MKVADITEDAIAITLDLHQWAFLLDIAIDVVIEAFLRVKELLETENLLLEGTTQDGNLSSSRNFSRRKLDFFDNASFAKLFELDHDTRGFWELDFVDGI